MVVSVEGSQFTPPQRVSIRREGAPLQVSIGRFRKVFKEPVDEVTLNRSPDGVWTPETELSLRSRRRFARFVGKVAGFAEVKQQKLAIKAMREVAQAKNQL